LTSPDDHDLMSSEVARPTRIASKASTCMIGFLYSFEIS
jgi:hypothetical protein